MSYVHHVYHIVFSTKNREPLITPDFQEDLYAYIGGIIREKQGHSIEIGGVQDHIHLLARFHQSVPHADMMRDIKSGSSRWVNDHKKCPKTFAWQTKYGSFSVSKSMEDTVREYIRIQEEHHRKVSFQAEFRALLAKHGIGADEAYIWE